MRKKKKKIQEVIRGSMHTFMKQVTLHDKATQNILIYFLKNHTSPAYKDDEKSAKENN